MDKLEKSIHIGNLRLNPTTEVWELSYAVGWEKLQYGAIPLLSLGLISSISMFSYLFFGFNWMDYLIIDENVKPDIETLSAIGMIIGFGGGIYDLIDKYSFKLLISEKGLERRKKDFSWEILPEVEKIVIIGKKSHRESLSIYSTEICFYLKNTDEY